MSIQTPFIEQTGLDIENHLINGSLKFWQRVAGNTTTFNNASVTLTYLADRIATAANGSTTKNYSIGRDSDVPTIAQARYLLPWSYNFTCLTGTSLGSNDICWPYMYRIEGMDYLKLHNRTATLSFWVKSNQPGTYSVAFNGLGYTRAYVTTFTINVADTWEFKSITLTFESSVYSFGVNQVGVEITIGQCGGSGATVNTNNVWTTVSAVTGYLASGSANIMATTGNYMKLAGLKMNVGAEASPFTLAGQTFNGEQSLCERYCESSFPFDAAFQTAFGSSYISLLMNFVNQFNTSFSERISYRVQKAYSPNVIFWNQTLATNQLFFYASSGSQYYNPNTYLANQNGFNIQFVAGNWLGCSGNWSSESEL